MLNNYEVYLVNDNLDGFYKGEIVLKTGSGNNKNFVRAELVCANDDTATFTCTVRKEILNKVELNTLDINKQLKIINFIPKDMVGV